MGIPVTYSGMLTQEPRNSREQETMWMMGRQHGQTSRR